MRGNRNLRPASGYSLGARYGSYAYSSPKVAAKSAAATTVTLEFTPETNDEFYFEAYVHDSEAECSNIAVTVRDLVSGACLDLAVIGGK